MRCGLLPGCKVVSLMLPCSHESQLASPVSLPFSKVRPFQPPLPRCLELPLGLIEAVDVATVHFDLVGIERCADTKCPEPALARTFLAD